MNKTLLLLLIAAGMGIGCNTNHKAIYSSYSTREADSIVSMLDSIAVEMKGIE